MTISRVVLIATIVFVAMVAFHCSSPTNGGNPPADTKIFAIKSGAFFQYLDYTADSTTHLRDTAPATIIRRHVVSIGLNVFAKTNVAMAIDSFFTEAMVPKAQLDTTYFVVEGAGKRISQYGFVASLVKQFSNNAIAINPHWNMLVALDLPTWTTDVTDTMISIAQVAETTTGKNLDTTTIAVNATSYLGGRGQHTGSAAVSALGLTVPISFTVDAIFDPTVIAAIVTKATSVGTTHIPEHHRTLTAFEVH